MPAILGWPWAPMLYLFAGQPVSGAGQRRAEGSELHQQKLRKQEASGAKSLREALGLLALLPLLSAQLKGRGFHCQIPSSGSVGASNPLLAQERGSAQACWRCPQRGFVRAWEQSSMQPQAHPSQSWNASCRARETGIGLELKISSVRVRGYINRGPVGRRRDRLV